jgi:alpha-ketoglutarate-dependent 2,4-dichlorophenoxyacetate dioxygenase
MPFTVKPITPSFAAEILDIDLARPVDPATFRALDDAFNQYAVLVYRDQHISDAQQQEFGKLWGPLETSVLALRKDQELRLPPSMADVSNLDHCGQVVAKTDRRRLYNFGNMLWHTDSSFKRVPALTSILYGREVPPSGGETQFADLRAAYDALDAATKAKIEDLICEHSIMHSRSLLGFTDWSEEERQGQPPVPQVLVRVHPGSKRKTLYLASHASHIIGWPVEEGRLLLRDLTDHATQREFVYTHQWRANDIVMWDNRCTMHRGRPYDDLKYKRDMRRVTVTDGISTVEREGKRLPQAVAAE